MTSPLFRALCFPALLLFPACRAQNPHAEKLAAPPPYSERLQAILTRAAAEAAALSDKLPSFACKETVISEELNLGKVRKRVDVVAELTVRRAADGKLQENFAAAEVDGRAFSGGKLKMPLYVNGGFQHALNYFSPELQPCYRYTLTASRIDFEAIPDAATRTGCTHEPGIKGFALVDQDDNIAHIERRVPDDLSKRFNSAPFAALDLVAVSLNDHIYRLSSHVVADMTEGKTAGRFEGTYTDCRLFTANITLRPGSSVITEDTPVPK